MRRTRGPFTEIAALTPLPAVTMEESDPDVIAARCCEINEILALHGCNCVGHERGLRETPQDPGLKHRDEYFAADLGELVARSFPHNIDGPTPGVSITVAVKLETLRAEVDEFGEVCAWIYEEDTP